MRHANFTMCTSLTPHGGFLYCINEGQTGYRFKEFTRFTRFRRFAFRRFAFRRFERCGFRLWP
jgi:hypothetical protein